MNNYKLFIFKGFFFHVILMIIFIILTTIVESARVVDELFEACKPKNCGNGPNISYPFWIHEEYCGYPEFRVQCRDNNPIIHTSGNDYIILKISYDSQSFRVENSVVMNGDCPAPLQNSTFDGPDTFEIGSNNDYLYFFYNCSEIVPDYVNLTYPVPCVTSSENVSFAMFMLPQHLSYVETQLKMCNTVIREPVEGDGVFSPTDPRDYKFFMENGFTLQWDKRPCNDCQESGGFCGVSDDKLACYCVDGPHHKRCNDDEGDDTKIPRKVKIGVGAAIGASLLTMLIVFILRRRKNSLNSSSALISRSISPDVSMNPDPEKGGNYFQTPIFTYKELEEATNNFDSSKELGDGGYGTVYHGELRDGRVVAVKRLYENNCRRVEQFMNEVTILSLLRHKNLVTLYGCTSRHSRELLLVYEYVPNGTVADHLHGEQAKPGLVTWPTRMSIAIESAGALAYLHASDIIHRDVKTNNILLDNNFHVKVADFGLSRLFPTDVTHVSTAPQGTPGYVDPEYYQCYQLTDKSDVYSFGVVLIELISSKPAVDISRHRHEINLSNMAINKIHNDALDELVDSSLGFESDSSVRRMMTSVAELAFRCLQQDSNMRPTMVEVVEVLKGIEKEGSKIVKGVDVDIKSEDVRLLKNIEPLSPDSVTGKWPSVVSTPNTSS